jgi:hypothetical protein
MSAEQLIEEWAPIIGFAVMGYLWVMAWVGEGSAASIGGGF